MNLPLQALEKALGHRKTWRHQCHHVSLALVKSGLIGEPCRVARGWCQGVNSQHSWVVLGDDCYSSDAQIVDLTLWSYDPMVDYIWKGRNYVRHSPHGSGNIWDVGLPIIHNKNKVVKLKGFRKLSEEAQRFLKLIGPMDPYAWSKLANGPVGGWPSAEIIDAMCDTKALAAVVPIDIVGMLTKRNPGGLYGTS